MLAASRFAGSKEALLSKESELGEVGEQADEVPPAAEVPLPDLRLGEVVTAATHAGAYPFEMELGRRQPDVAMFAEMGRE